VIEHFFAPFLLFCPPIAPFVFFVPLSLNIDPKGAIPPTLRTTGLDVTFIQERICACG